MKMILIEDMDLFDPKSSSSVISLAINGAHQNLGLCWVNHRLLNLDFRLLKKTQYYFLGYGIPEIDISYLKNYISIDSERYKEIRPFQFLVFDRMEPKNAMVIDSNMNIV